MQEIIKARVDETGEWVRCGRCGGKLFKIKKFVPINGVEIKCHSCKSINVVDTKQK